MTPLFDPSRIVFIKEGHEYFVDVEGNDVYDKKPSLSQVLKEENLAPVYPDDIPEFVMERARIKGTLVHEAVHKLLLDEPYEIDKKYKQYVDNALRLIEKHQMKPFLVETPLYQPEFEYCCTPDFVGYVDGRPAIVDWKTTSVYQYRGGLQLMGQDACLDGSSGDFDLYIGDLRAGELKQVDDCRYEDFFYRKMNLRKELAEWDKEQAADKG